MYKVVVWVMLEKDKKILLLKKPDDSEWTLAGGHVEDNESLKMAAIRKTEQEVDIKLNESDLSFLCVIDRKMDDAYKLHVFFKASKWQGELNNNEPRVHSEIKWHDLNELPENLGVLASDAVDSFKTSKTYHFEEGLEAHNKH